MCFPGNTNKTVGILCNKDGAEYVLGHNCVWFHIQITVTIGTGRIFILYNSRFFALIQTKMSTSSVKSLRFWAS